MDLFLDRFRKTPLSKPADNIGKPNDLLKETKSVDYFASYANNYSEHFRDPIVYPDYRPPATYRNPYYDPYYQPSSYEVLLS